MQLSNTLLLMSRRLVLAGAILSSAAFAGTLSPEFKSLPSSRNVEVIVRFSPGVSALALPGHKLADLPEGGLYSMTPAQAQLTAQTSGVVTVSTNRPVYSTGSSSPVYDFMPQTIQPQSPISGYPNLVQGAGIGVVVIDSGIHVN